MVFGRELPRMSSLRERHSSMVQDIFHSSATGVVPISKSVSLFQHPDKDQDRIALSEEAAGVNEIDVGSSKLDFLEIS